MQGHREADRDPEKQTTSELCVVCMSCPRSVRFQCGHYIACRACAGGFKICPFCRQRILAIIGVQEDNLGDSDLTFSMMTKSAISAAVKPYGFSLVPTAQTRESHQSSIINQVGKTYVTADSCFARNVSASLCARSVDIWLSKPMYWQ